MSDDIVAEAPPVRRSFHRTALATIARAASGSWQRDVSLATLGRWRIGGPADLVITPANIAALGATLAAVIQTGVPYVVIGDGSNLLFDDAGFRGVVIRIGRAFDEFSVDDDGIVTAGAGLWVPSFVRQVIAHGMAGATHAIGIPGTLGGLVTMNGGSQRHGIGEHVESVDVVERGGNPRRFMASELGYAYRTSILQTNGAIAVSARFRFSTGDPAALRREALVILASRRAKFPRIRANCGSVFVSDPALYDLIGPPGAAIERVGLKGFAIGDAQISTEHANFIVNTGHARSADVLSLIGLARRRVHDLTGIAMDAEVRHLASNGTLRPAHEIVGPPLFSDVFEQDTRS